jgi:hypothetical protein
MGKLRGVGIGIVFLIGCAAGGVARKLVVPPANAQQAATLTKWEYMCQEAGNLEQSVHAAKEAGLQGWEVVGFPKISTWCFKRPRL